MGTGSMRAPIYGSSDDLSAKRQVFAGRDATAAPTSEFPVQKLRPQLSMRPLIGGTRFRTTQKGDPAPYRKITHGCCRWAIDPLVPGTGRDGTWSGTADRYCGARPQAADRALALRDTRRGAGGCGAENGLMQRTF